MLPIIECQLTLLSDTLCCNHRLKTAVANGSSQAKPFINCRICYIKLHMCLNDRLRVWMFYRFRCFDYSCLIKHSKRPNGYMQTQYIYTGMEIGW